MDRQLLVLSILLQNYVLAVECECSKSGVCLPKDYDKDRLPSIPVHIDAFIDIVQVTEVDDTLATVDILAWHGGTKHKGPCVSFAKFQCSPM